MPIMLATYSTNKINSTKTIQARRAIYQPRIRSLTV